MTNADGSDAVWSGHLMHRWSKWRPVEVTTTSKRWDDAEHETVVVERVSRNRYRVCAICGAEQEAP